MSVPSSVLGRHSGVFFLCDTTSREVRGGSELVGAIGVEG